MSTVQPEDADGEQTTESVAKLRARVEDSGAQGELLPVVEHGEEVQGAGEEDGFDETEEEARHEQALVVVHDRHEGGDDAPGGHAGADVDTGPLDLTDDHVGRNLHQD